jgi:hypothetical protein
VQTPSTSVPSPKPIISSGGASENDNPKHDIFSDPELTKNVTDDPLFRALTKHWRQLLVVIAAVVFGSFAWQRFQETKDERLGDYSEVYTRASDQLTTLAEKSKALAELKVSLVTMDEESRKKLSDAELALTEAQNRLEDTVKSLGDTAEPYTSFVPLYRGLAAALSADKANAVQILQADDWRTAESRGKGAQFASELAALARARVLVDDDARLAEGIALLKDLSLSSKFVFAGAVVTLQRVAQTPEQKAEAAAVLDQVRNERPEQAELLKQAVTGF